MSFSSLFRAARRIVRRPLLPRSFPTTGFNIIDKASLLEEETDEWYEANEFYPVRVGEVFRTQYQVVGKLGYGAYATAWLCRDLIEYRHVALKIGASSALSGELSILKHLNSIRTTHAGSLLVRDLLDEFPLTYNEKTYHGIVHSPLAVTLGGFRRMVANEALQFDLLKAVLKHVFLALDFLHTEAKVIHTDIQEKNILLGLDEKTAKDDLQNFEMQELQSPSPRKIIDDRTIYMSKTLVPRHYKYGRPVLCDFGQACFGQLKYTHDIQPYQYRAPEVFLQIPWDEKVDIWNVGVMIWDLLGYGNLFNTKGGPDNKDDNIYHLAHMIALLGPPPLDFLERTQAERLWQWFDRNGTWKAGAEIPETSFEDAGKNLKGEDKTMFLRFMRRMLKWKPEERSSARELLEDPWLNQN